MKVKKLQEGYDSVIKDLESIELFLRRENFDSYDVIDYNEFPMGTSVISFEVEGDWKHEHLLFEDLIYEWAEENDKDIFKIDSETVEETGSDWYTARYKVFITKDHDTTDKLNSMRRLFAESKRSRTSKQAYKKDSMDNIRNKVIKSIQDEWETISYYNDLIDDLEADGDTDGVNVIDDINKEEHTHVGQLQSLLQTMGGDIEAIHQGNKEGDQQLAEELNTELQTQINNFIEESRGYNDYDGIVEDVADEFDLSKEDAEQYVWNYMYIIGHDVNSMYDESLNKGKNLKEAITTFNSNEDWVNYLAKKLDLDTYEVEMLEHDLNNLRADEWIDYMKSKKVPKAVVNKFVQFFGLNEELHNDYEVDPNTVNDYEVDDDANDDYTYYESFKDEPLYALRNFKKHAQNGDELKIDINGNKGEVSKEADGWYLYYGGLVTQGSYKIIEATIKDILNRNSEKDVFLSEDYSKEEKKADFIKALKLCAAYDPNTLYIDNYSQKQAAEAKNREINTAFDKIMMKYNVKSTGVPTECTNLKSESDYINKLKQYIAKNKKVMKESFDPYSIEYWNYDPDEIEVGIEYCENNFIDPHSLNPTDFENIVILANGYYPHNEGWKYTDAEILSALDYILEKGMMLSSLTPQNFEEIIKKANELDECAKMTNKEIKESLNKLDIWAIDNDATFYDLKTLYEAFINPHSPIDQKKKDKIQKALNDPTMNRDTEKLQDYIAGILVRQEESLEETLDDQEDFNNLKTSSKILPVNTLGTLPPEELNRLELRRDELLDKEDHNTISPKEKKELIKLNKKINDHYKEKKRLMNLNAKR